jgi:uncharacterized protein YdeI (YjbR/CyaY-like superfamily)
MAQANPSVDIYFSEGCGRCSLTGTPACKVHTWTEALYHLRAIILDCGLQEERKWGVPCYTFQDKNVILLGAFKDNCVISFVKGALLKDEQGILTKPGENSHSTRVIRFTNAQQVIDLEESIKSFIYETIENEKAGLKVAAPQHSIDYPEELVEAFEQNPDFFHAFQSLTAGRQRSYLMHYIAAKQANTRASRIEKTMDKVFLGKGFNEY